MGVEIYVAWELGDDVPGAEGGCGYGAEGG